MKNILKIITLFFVVCFIASCATTKNKSVHGDKPLIDTKEIREQAHKEMTRIEEAVPERYDPEMVEDTREDKRETIITEHTRSYEFIPTTDEYAHLRQSITINLNLSLIHI